MQYIFTEEELAELKTEHEKIGASRVEKLVEDIVIKDQRDIRIGKGVDPKYPWMWRSESIYAEEYRQHPIRALLDKLDSNEAKIRELRNKVHLLENAAVFNLQETSDETTK